MLDHLTLFLNAYQDTPKFSFIWNAELAHDDSQVLYKADLAIYNFLVKNKNSLSNSFLFFFGDHGPRYGKEASTWLGAKERNNPFLYITVPYSVRKTALYQQLRRNSEELVTHHDLYATLLDILRVSDYTFLYLVVDKLPNACFSSLFSEEQRTLGMLHVF
ncbi:hypothetical protein OESDEN_03963 [Oesophagostomum dentatum]|uniref:Sulfatase N-terminal domain-containing protein n=1 Tax=Oesophagostomum dentatum TaxID=61180 RepID=A0A0B1TFQ2_OESDE|nr:hypothetical protein OESDEN_03963 [Oesophagostomum dentatum]